MIDDDYEGYDVAQICLNGHVINSCVLTSPDTNADFCDKCGASTLTQCDKCNNGIRGYYHASGVWGSYSYSPPSFCHACGKPYPWIEAKLKAAQDLSDELDNLTQEEKDTLKRGLDDMVRDTPQTTVATTRFKRLVAKAGKGAAEGFKSILVDVVSEAAKKVLWP